VQESARGDLTSVPITRVPFPAETSSTTVVDLMSRSRIKNVNRPVRSSRLWLAAML
jgi:hypothetical protein